MDKNKFWLGGRLFNTASPRLGAPTQRKARPQDGRPNATQGMYASWAPQRNARQIRKLGAPTHVCNANARHLQCNTHVRKYKMSTRPQFGRPNAMQGTSARWSQDGHPNARQRRVRKMGIQTKNRSATKTSTQGSPNATQGTSASWAPQRNARHVCKLRAPTHICNANARHVGTSENCAPQHNATHVRKMVAQTQNSSTRKTSTQGSTRLKDELEDG
jgi:hypothetical protein